MCYACWKNAGQPQIDTPLVREAAVAIEDVYYFHGAGGHLHIVTDDWNLGDESLAFCDQQITLGINAREDPPDQLAAESRCLELLKALTEEERYSALALSEGFWGFHDDSK